MKTYLLLFILASKALAGNYTIVDLEALHKANSHKEFLRHAKDILPRDRNDYWQNLLKLNAESFVQEKLTNKDFSQSTFKFIESIAYWAELKKAEYFQQKRNEFALNYFKSCKSIKCKKQTISFWNSSNQRAELALAFLEKHGPLYTFNEKVDFMRALTLHRFSNFYCKKPLVQKLSLKYILKSFNADEGAQEIIKKSSEIFNRNCLKELAQMLGHSLNKLSLIEGETVYRFLKSYKLITKEEESYFLTLFILKGPFVGSTLNYAWKNLEYLGAKPQLRENILNRLKNGSWLPGGLFSVKNEQRKMAILKLINANMPEYLDHYTRECINFYSGKKHYPKGNPTMECKELVQISAKSRILPRNLNSSLQKLKL